MELCVCMNWENYPNFSRNFSLEKCDFITFHSILCIVRVDHGKCVNAQNHKHRMIDTITRRQIVCTY